MVVAQTSVEELGGTHRQSETSSSSKVPSSACGPGLQVLGGLAGGAVLAHRRRHLGRLRHGPAGSGGYRRLRLPSSARGTRRRPCVTATYDPSAPTSCPSTSQPPLRPGAPGGLPPAPDPSDYLLYGDVVLVGSTAARDVDVPARFYRLLALLRARSKPDPPGPSRTPGRLPGGRRPTAVRAARGCRCRPTPDRPCLDMGKRTTP